MGNRKQPFTGGDSIASYPEHKCDFKQLNVLVRADGMVSKVRNDQIPGRLSRLWGNKNRGLLIDFNDCWTPWAQRNTHAREATYKRNKWEKCKTLEELFSNAIK